MAERSGFHAVKQSRYHQPCFPCSSARIQFQSRGAKRKRAAFSTSRDWASLGHGGPACLIAKLVLTDDVADYVRFRAVCRAWRRCSFDPRPQDGLDARFLPRQWIMLDKASAIAAGPRRRRFLNVSSGECIRTDLPELAAHTLHAVTPEGLLLLFHKPTLVLRLLNPLTRRLTDLPPVTTLLTEQQRSRLGVSDYIALGERLLVYSAGVASADDACCTVAVRFRFPMVVAVAKPGDERWTLVDTGAGYVAATLPFAGRFYCALQDSSIMLLDDDSRLVTAVAPSFDFRLMADSLHLVDNAGELMLVHRRLMICRDDDDDARGGRYKRDYRVYRVDLDAGALVPAKGFNDGRAVFMGLDRAISVRAGAFPSVAADTLYLGSDCEEKTSWNKIRAYNVADGSTQPYHRRIDVVQAAYGVVDCISDCVRGNGSHLA